jgi:hypothetical protein
VCQFFEHGEDIPSLPSRTEFAVARKPQGVVPDDLADFVFDVIDQLDPSAIECAYEE